MISAILICRKLGAGPAGKYVFKGANWEEAKGGPAWEDLTLEVSEPTPASYPGGKELTVRRIKGDKSSERDATVFTVGTDGRFVSFGSTGAPITVIAADLAGEARPPEKPVQAGTDTPKAAATLYLQALAGVVPMEKMREVMDWEALKKDAAATHPDINALDLETYVNIFLAELEKQVGVITKEQVDLVLPMLKVEEKGDTATVVIPGQDDKPFHLRKTEAGWIITRIPQ
jgi:hypothetical protein